MIPADASWRLLSLLWQASWQGALFVGVVALFCFVFRAPAPYRATLWFLAGVKFLGGFLWLLFVGTTVPLKVPLPAPLSPVTRTPSVWNTHSDPVAFGVAATWFLGVALCLVMVAYRAYITYRIVANSKPLTDGTITILLAHLSEQIGVSRKATPSVCVTPKEVDGPQVTLSRDKCVVILPETLLTPSPTALNEEDLRFVLAHELAHIRRGDLWAGLLFAAMQILFFFHPCAVWVKREWEAAREEDCDLMALRACAEGDRSIAAKYGALLLRLGSGATAGGVTAANIAASPFAALRRRLNHLNSYQTKSDGRFPQMTVLLGLPVLAVLLLPVEFHWSVSRPSARQTYPVALRRSPLQKQTALLTTARVARTVRTPAVRKPAVFTVGTKVVAEAPPRLAEPVRVPLAITVVRKPRRNASRSLSPELSPAETKQATIPTLSEPLLVMRDTGVAAIATSDSSAGLAPVMPEVASVSNAIPSQPLVTNGGSAPGEVSSSRYTETSPPRTPGIVTDAKGAGHTGFTIPGFESGHSLTKPLPSPSQSPPPSPNENPLQTQDMPRPPHR